MKFGIFFGFRLLSLWLPLQSHWIQVGWADRFKLRTGKVRRLGSAALRRRTSGRRSESVRDITREMWQNARTGRTRATRP
jgi:hypothetical protein